MKPKKWTAEEKMAAVLEALRGLCPFQLPGQLAG